MVQLTRIYTKSGDKGKTGLGDGTRVLKDDVRIHAIGDVDEVNATVGLAILHVSKDAQSILLHIQNDLFDVGADLCVPSPKGEPVPVEEGKLRIVETQVTWLENTLDTLNEELSPLTSFVLPGGSAGSAYLHLARTVARRAERSCVTLNEHTPINSHALKYMNRLSDLFFVMGRFENDKGRGDILWIPGGSRGKA